MKRIKNTGLCVLITILSLLLANTGLAQTDEDRIKEIISAIDPFLVIEGRPQPAPVSLDERMAQLAVTGVSIAVFSDGKIDWARGFGFADAHKSAPVTSETLFQAASISKVVTALTALRLVEQGQIALDTPVNEQLVNWKLPHDEVIANHPVTPRHLLSHSAGTTVGGFPGYPQAEKLPSLVDVLSGNGNTAPVSVSVKPGTMWRYSGGGYLVIQKLIEDVTGYAFDEAVARLVLAPLAMNDSTFTAPLPESLHGRAAAGFDSTGAPIPGEWHNYVATAAGGLWTTAADLARYAIEVQQAYQGKGKILSGRMAHEMLQPGIGPHGLGPVIQDNGARFGHSGGNFGYRTEMTAFVDSGSGVVVLTNSENGTSLIRELLITIARVYGWPGIDPIRKSVINLEPESYERLVGTYRASAGNIREIEISYDDGSLTASVPSIPGIQPLELLPESALSFFAREDGGPVQFVSQDDVVVELVMSNGTRYRRESTGTE